MADYATRGTFTRSDSSGMMSIQGSNERSVLLEVGGELTVPDVVSKEELAEKLASGKYVLSLKGAEVRIADDVRKELYEALGVEPMSDDELTRRLLLNGVVSNAPPGSHELVKRFLRKGTREQHFAVVRELARRRREELEKGMKKPMPQRLPSRPRSQASTDTLTEALPAVTVHHAAEDTSHQAASDERVEAESTEATTSAAAAADEEKKKDELFPHHVDELSSYRSATTASELGTARGRSDQ
ncbi:hypothetical protein Emed_001258 [Eimeria media]